MFGCKKKQKNITVHIAPTKFRNIKISVGLFKKFELEIGRTKILIFLYRSNAIFSENWFSLIIRSDQIV